MKEQYSESEKWILDVQCDSASRIGFRSIKLVETIVRERYYGGMDVLWEEGFYLTHDFGMIINEPIDLFPWPSNIKYQHLTLSCANHNTKLASKASCIQGDLCQSISFIGKSELLTVCKTFVCSLMEYCFLLWAVAPVSHLSVLDSVESKVLKKIGFFHDEAEAQCVLLSHCRQVSGLFIFCNLFSNIAPSALSFL